MSVIVMDMEMPRTCSDCEWSYYVGNGRAMCKRVSKTDKTDIMTKRRADFCPLAEIHTPHGRLIDADVPLEKVSKMMQEPDYQHECENWMVGLIMARDAIDEADTIIEAED